MQLAFLGTGSAYNPELGNTSAYMMIDQCMVLFDCGETVFEKLMQKDLLEQADDLLILITHLHSDHIGSLGSFLSYTHHCLGKTAYVLFPDSDLDQVLRITGVDKSLYHSVREVPECLNLGLEAISMEVQHSPRLKCYGYLIKKGMESFFYGGDSTFMPDSILDMLTKEKLCRVYQDTTYEKDEGRIGHGCLEVLCRRIPQNVRSRVTCMHFGSSFQEAVVSCGFVPAVAEEEN